MWQLCCTSTANLPWPMPLMHPTLSTRTHLLSCSNAGMAALHGVTTSPKLPTSFSPRAATAPALLLVLPPSRVPTIVVHRSAPCILVLLLLCMELVVCSLLPLPSTPHVAVCLPVVPLCPLLLLLTACKCRVLLLHPTAWVAVVTARTLHETIG